MNLASPWDATSRALFHIAMKCRRFLPKKRSQAFGLVTAKVRPKIERIYVINLNRQPARLAEMEQELRRVLDWSGAELWSLTERYAAVDSRHFIHDPSKDADVDPFYTLGEQLFVEPQPLALPTRLDLNSPIRMSHPEIAIARSHIDIWRLVAAGNHQYVLVLEDDVWFRFGFATHLDQAWGEIEASGERNSNFDIFYLSYEEVNLGAPKTFLSSNVFRPVRGLWHLSGYVISRAGARKLLQLLPCRGPVDLWINHQFGVLDVRATRRSIISQRRDVSSTNSYSVLPSLTKIGAINSEGASLFHVRPSEMPVFAFGPRGSGLSSLAMALSMLGYRCCSDLHELPASEHEMLLAGDGDRVFDAYVNIRSLGSEARALVKRYPRAKVIITKCKTAVTDDNDLRFLVGLEGAEIAVLHHDAPNKWQVICEHLRCSPPACSFPDLADRGQRQIRDKANEPDADVKCETPKRDKSPWVVEPRQWWKGIHSVPIKGESAVPIKGESAVPIKGESAVAEAAVRVKDCLEYLDTSRWLPR